MIHYTITLQPGLLHDAPAQRTVGESELRRASRLLSEKISELGNIHRPLTYKEKVMLTRAFVSLLELYGVVRDK